MTERNQTSECANCGASIYDDEITLDLRKPCNMCGSTMRIHSASISEPLIAIFGYGLKAKRHGQKKPYVEELSMPDYSISRKKQVQRLRIIDRDHDRYFEKITDYQSGEVIHHCEENLSKHQGHGNAKRKNSKD